MQKFLIAAIFLLGTLVTKAQQEGIIEKAPDEVKGSVNKGQKQKVVTVRLKGDKAKEEKITIEIDGNKIKVNGKDVADVKDIDITIGNNSFQFNSISPRVLQFKKFNDDQRRLNEVIGKMQDRKNLQLFYKDKAILGIGMKKVDGGVEITSITEGSGAQKAGLKEGDIITKINGKSIISEMDITKLVNAEKPGATMDITYKRDGKEKTTKATLGKREMNHDAFEMPGMLQFEGQDNLFNQPFAEVSPLAPMENFNFDFKGEMPDMHIFGNGQNLAGLLGAPKLGITLKETESGTGLEVTDVEENSAAAKAGLQKGDIVTTVAGDAISSVMDIKKSVDKNHTKPFEVKYLRNGKEQKTEIKFPKKLKEVEL